MLISCPECSHEMSDKAAFCPNCGYPRKENIIRSSRRRHRRLPNGFGQISEIKGQNLRKPFRVMVPAGKTDEGKPISKLLKPEAYFSTYNEAYTALLKYNENPYDPRLTVTMNDLFEQWLEKYKKAGKSDSAIRNAISAWRYCEQIHDLNVRQVHTRQILLCIDDDNMMPRQKKRCKILLNMLFTFAVELEYTDRNYAKDVRIPEYVSKEIEESKTHHIDYADDEMTILWKHVSTNLLAEIIIVQCYSGWRPSELLSLKLSDIDLENKTVRGGSKTEAGKDRTVPIHSKIYKLVRSRYNKSKAAKSEYLFCSSGKPISYDSFSHRLPKLFRDLDLNPAHRAHDGRVQFVTMAKRCNVNEYAIKYLVGHKIQDLTENTYTKRDIEWLRSEIEKIS